MKKQPTLGPRTDVATALFYKHLFGSTNAGAEFVINAFPGWYRRALSHSFRHKFSAQELMLLIDSYNGTMLSPDFSGRAVVDHVSDAIEHEHLAEKYGVDANKLVTDLALMDPFDHAALEIWCKAYWEQMDKGLALEKYVDALAK